MVHQYIDIYGTTTTTTTTTTATMNRVLCREK
ncbi:unnamed protein product [Onchocerca flexuosa]|uniref:Uncharacterized protein n=1 Tax=Onchocerca flexuosa TaxID=387005 RepID=A0A183HXR2_9BILA|nr:unnamed protein product [Onchocerca flexuosa]